MEVGINVHEERDLWRIDPDITVLVQRLPEVHARLRLMLQPLVNVSDSLSFKLAVPERQERLSELDVPHYSSARTSSKEGLSSGMGLAILVMRFRSLEFGLR